MSFLRFSKLNFNVIFCNFWKIWNRTDSKYSVNSEFLETLVFVSKTGFLTQTYFWTIFASSKKQIFPKNFQTLITKQFRNLWKQKAQKIPSFAGPYIQVARWKWGQSHVGRCFSIQIIPRPIFHHYLQFLGRGRKAIPFGSLFRPFLFSSEQKVLNAF